MRLRFTVLFIFALLALAVEGQAEAATISFDFSQELGEISPYVYGANYGAGAGTSIASVEMAEEAAASGITFFRFPGGNWGDQNNVRPQQIDLFMLQARAWGVEPSFHVRFLNSTPEEAAEMVRYANIEKGYNIRYWYIGNEPSLFYNDIEGFDPIWFSNQWREFALAMEAVDPTILFIGPEVHQYADSYEPSYLDEFRAFVRDFLTINGDMVDIVSVHRYPFPLEMNGDPITFAQARENVPNWSTLVEILRTDIRDTIGRDLPVAITEANSHWSNSGGGFVTPDSYYNAIWWSGVLTTLIHSDVEIVAIWNFASTGGNGVFGLLDRYSPRPTYYTYQLYREFGTMRLFSESSDEYITALAARREDGTITLVITNLYDAEAKSVSLDFGGASVSVTEMQVLAPDLLAETVEPSAYFDGTVLQMPAQSAIRLVLTVES
jgi:hypothetical protein